MGTPPSSHQDRLARIETLELRSKELMSGIRALSDFKEIHRSLEVDDDVRLIGVSAITNVLQEWLRGMGEERARLT